jgi:anti-sigma factor RsiW
MNCPVTYEELAAFTAGDTEAARLSGLEDHLDRCGDCRERLKVLRNADAALRSLFQEEPPDRAIRAAWREAVEEIAWAFGHEVMTLAEVAAFLRVPQDDLETLAAELPAFELAGRIRVRRTKLLEWIEERERLHRRSALESELASALARGFRKGKTVLGMG